MIIVKLKKMVKPKIAKIGKLIRILINVLIYSLLQDFLKSV